MFQDDPERLRAAAAYLEHHAESERDPMAWRSEVTRRQRERTAAKELSEAELATGRPWVSPLAQAVPKTKSGTRRYFRSYRGA